MLSLRSNARAFLDEHGGCFSACCLSLTSEVKTNQRGHSEQVRKEAWWAPWEDWWAKSLRQKQLWGLLRVQVTPGQRLEMPYTSHCSLLSALPTAASPFHCQPTPDVSWGLRWHPCQAVKLVTPPCSQSWWSYCGSRTRSERNTSLSIS